MRRSAVFVALLLSSCGGQEPCPEAHFDDEISIPETASSLTVNARVNAHTSSGANGVEVSIADNQGSIAYAGRGPLQAFIYQQEPWVPGVLLSGLAVGDGSWSPFWLYCSEDGRLTDLYGERTDRSQPIFPAISGTCTFEPGPFVLEMRVPAHRIHHVAMTCGFSVSDESDSSAAPVLNLVSSMPGNMRWDGNPATVLVFSTADCRDGCASETPWFELHSILWDPIASRIAFGIFYIFPDNPSPGVALTIDLELPAGRRGGVEFPTASWTLPR